ncbi:hypothetical protein L6452_15849 [Arctium lappa]|uniref:Uncharacterized protein n=1 Tax=Arctium lappa TaxID=4217 RepID=A0ACB9CQ07_ARCLA|nr:hypothetical protein L6452_15849 [Arctium lappa]
MNKKTTRNLFLSRTQTNPPAVPNSRDLFIIPDLEKPVLFIFSIRRSTHSPMAPPPGPYSGTSTLALVARVSAFSVGLVYGSMKLKYLQAKAKSQRKAAAKEHH